MVGEREGGGMFALEVVRIQAVWEVRESEEEEFGLFTEQPGILCHSVMQGE